MTRTDPGKNDSPESNYLSSKHAITRIPFMFHVSPGPYSETFELKNDAKGEIRHMFHDKKQYPTGHDYNQMIIWANAASGHSVQIYKSSAEKVMNLLMTLSLLIMLMVALYLLLVVFVQAFPNVMPYGAMVLLTIGQSGLMYNVIQVIFLPMGG